jgi:hypothetical protein
MNIDNVIQDIVNTLEKPILELYCDEDLMGPYESITIPEPIEVFVSDYVCYDLKLPKTLRVLDLHYWGYISMRFNMPSNIQDIILRYVDIEDKTFMELFPPTCIRYRYVGCNLNGIPLNKILRDKYIKYFQKEPVYKNKGILNENIVYYRYHNVIIDEIKDYEILIKKVKEKTKMFKEELIQVVYHPDRVEKGINKYGFEYIDTL